MTHTIYDYETGAGLRDATPEEYRMYMDFIKTLPTSQRTIGAVDGTPYGYTQTIYMD